MPQHKSAAKRIRSSARKRARNKADVTRIKSAVRKVRTAKDKAGASAALKIAVKVLDQMAAKGIIHRNKAANQKSKLTKYVSKMA